MRIKNADLSVLKVILEKAGRNEDPDACWHIADRQLAIQDDLEKIKIATSETSKYREYNDRYMLLLGQYKKNSGQVVGPLGNAMTKYEKKDDASEEKFNEEWAKLMIDYDTVIKEDIERRTKIDELMNKEIDVDIEPLKYIWCKGFVNANDVLFLRKLGMIVNDNK